MRSDRSFFARSSSLWRVAVSPLPARLMKKLSMRMPEAGPFGDTFFDASVRAMRGALFRNKPSGGCVDSVLTRATQRRFAGVFFAAALRDVLLRAVDLRVVRVVAELRADRTRDCLPAVLLRADFF